MSSSSAEPAPAPSAPALAAQDDPGDVARASIGRVHELYRDHSPRLVRRLTRQTGCREAALEIAQEAFLRLLRMTPARFLGIDDPEAYLRSVATNLARDWGRARVRANGSLASLAVLAEDRVDQVAILQSRETLRRLEVAMSKLKPRTREIFLAHRLHGLSYSEIASRTGLTVKGVEKQMSKAIAKIDRLLDRA